MDTQDKPKPVRTSLPVDYYHPLRLQRLTPEQFTEVVNEILSGKLKLLIRRIDSNGS